MITKTENKATTKTTTVADEVAELRRQGVQMRTEAYGLLLKADEIERNERRRADAERRENEIAALRANPTKGLIIGSVDDVVSEDRRTGDIEVREVEVLYERRTSPEPVAHRWPDGSVHWIRNPMHLHKAGIDVTKVDLGVEMAGQQKRVPIRRRFQSFTSRDR